MNGAAALLLACALAGGSSGASPVFTYDALPPLPEPIGVSGYIAGLLGSRFVLVGGNNFPSAPPWAGGERQHYDTIRLLELEERKWTVATAKLPEKLSYAASGVLDNMMIVAGGATTRGTSARVFALTAQPDGVAVREVAPLPVALSHASAVVGGDRLFIVGGLLASGESTDRCWAGRLARNREEIEWAELPTIPAQARHFAVVGTDGSTLFVISGMRSRRDTTGAVVLEKPYLKDAHALTLDTHTWRRLPNPPCPVAAAPGPAAYLRDRHALAIFGGLAGDDAGIPLDRYPPFTTRVLVYSITERRWQQIDDALPVAYSRVTASLVPWRQGFLLFAGETAPGKRTPHGVLIRPR